MNSMTVDLKTRVANQEVHEEGKTMLIERYKYGVRVYDPINSHYSFYIKESDGKSGWCEVLVQEDSKTLDAFERKCVLKNRDLVELLPLLQEIFDYMRKGYMWNGGEKLKIDQIIIVDKSFGP